MRQRKGLSVWNIEGKEYHKLYDTVIFDRDWETVGFMTL